MTESCSVVSVQLSCEPACRSMSAWCCKVLQGHLGEDIPGLLKGASDVCELGPEGVD